LLQDEKSILLFRYIFTEDKSKDGGTSQNSDLNTSHQRSSSVN